MQQWYPLFACRRQEKTKSSAWATRPDLDGHQDEKQPDKLPVNLSCGGSDHFSCDRLPEKTDAQAAQLQSPYQKYIQEQNRPATEADKLNTLKHAGEMGDAGVKAGLAVVGAEAAVAGVVVAAPTAVPAISSAGSQALTAANSAYVQAGTALSAAGAAISNGATTAYNAVINTARAAQAATFRAAVWADTLRSGGGAFNGARDFVQAATSDRMPPAPNNYGAAGLVVKVVRKILSQ